METIENIWNFIADNVGPHWPALVYLTGFSFAGQLMKRFVFTEKNVRKWAGLRDRLWNAGGAKKIPGVLLKIFIGTPLPVHPVITAFALSAFFLPISEGLENVWGYRVTYLVGCALGSLAFYDLLHAILRKRGLDFKLPGEATIPPPAPGADDPDKTPVPGEKPEDEERGGP